MIPLTEKFWNIFWHIAVGIIIPVLLVIISFELSNKKIEPVYSITKKPSLIYDVTKSSPKYKLILADSTIIDRNVYVISIAIWNEGQLEIKKSDVRKDIKILPYFNSKLIDYKIVKSIRPDISKFRIIDSSDYYTLDWNHFDPGFGLEIQIIYAGNDSSKIAVDGYFFGTDIKEVSARKSLNGGGIFLLISLCIFLIGWIIIAIVQWKKSQSKEPWRKESKVKLGFDIVLIIGVIIYIILTFFSENIFGHRIPF
jgi:hypothetical protein